MSLCNQPLLYNYYEITIEPVLCDIFLRGIIKLIKKINKYKIYLYISYVTQHLLNIMEYHFNQINMLLNQLLLNHK